MKEVIKVIDYEKVYELINSADVDELGICPNCGAQLEFDDYKGKYLSSILYCPNGDFISRQGSASMCLAEALEGLRWVKKMKEENKR